MCWKEVFPNEDATRFDLVGELYAPPAKMPTNMYQFASWLENWKDACLKLVVLARARARELQVDQVERAQHCQQPLSAKTAIPTTNSKAKFVTETDKPVCRFSSTRWMQEWG